jgi:hypothetical protein
MMRSRVVATLTSALCLFLTASICPAFDGGPGSGSLLLVGSQAANCSPTTLSYNVDPTSPMTISAAVLVHRSSVAEVQRALDPQNWDVCSKFWSPPPRTYLATRSGSTITEDPPKPSNVAYQHQLYEHFHSIACQFGICHEADFENMLDITSTPGATSYRAEYALVAPPVRGTIDGVAVTLKVDDGYIAASPGPEAGTWVIEGRKMLLFDNPIANTWAQIAFGFGLRELASEIAQIACCDVPPPS